MGQTVFIPLDAIEIRVSRSSGPGGQHVNKTDTRVEALVNVDSAAFLSDDQKELIKNKLASRISKAGYLAVTCQQTRSQLTNKEIAITKLQVLLNKGLQIEKPRKVPKIPKAVKEQRMKDKREHSEKKKERSNWKKLL